MAIVRSHSMSNAKKSAGLITYRTIRGRQIASQKRAGWTSGQQSQGLVYKYGLQQSIFGVLNAFCGKHALSIKRSFDKTKFGSARNYMTKLNYGVFAQFYNWAMANPSISLIYHEAGTDPLGDTNIAQWESALKRYLVNVPSASVARVMIKGAERQYLSAASGKLDWTEVQDPIINAVTVSNASAIGLLPSFFATQVSIQGENFAAVERVYYSTEGVDVNLTFGSKVITNNTISFKAYVPGGGVLPVGTDLKVKIIGVNGDELTTTISTTRQEEEVVINRAIAYDGTGRAYINIYGSGLMNSEEEFNVYYLATDGDSYELDDSDMFNAHTLYDDGTLEIKCNTDTTAATFIGGKIIAKGDDTNYVVIQAES